MSEDEDWSDIELELKRLDNVKKNLDWFMVFKKKENIRIREEDHEWFESTISESDFKTNLKLQKIIKDDNE